MKSRAEVKCFRPAVSKQPNKAVSANIADSELILADGDAFRDDPLGLEKRGPFFFSHYLFPNPR